MSADHVPTTSWTADFKLRNPPLRTLVHSALDRADRPFALLLFGKRELCIDAQTSTA